MFDIRRACILLHITGEKKEKGGGGARVEAGDEREWAGSIRWSLLFIRRRGKGGEEGGGGKGKEKSGRTRPRNSCCRSYGTRAKKKKKKEGLEAKRAAVIAVLKSG